MAKGTGAPGCAAGLGVHGGWASRLAPSVGFWAGAALLYTTAAMLLFHPLAWNLWSHHLGAGVDFHNEAWLHWLLWNHPETLSADGTTWMVNAPDGENVVVRFFSFLHVVLAGGLSQVLPWPAWWNALCLLPLLLNGLAVCWYIRRSGSALQALLGGLAMVLQPWAVAELNQGHLQQVWLAPLVLAFASAESALQQPGRWTPRFILAGSVSITTLIFWPYGAFLALAGGLRWLFEAGPEAGDRRRTLLWSTALAFVLLVGPAVLTLRLTGTPPYQGGDHGFLRSLLFSIHFGGFSGGAASAPPLRVPWLPAWLPGAVPLVALALTFAWARVARNIGGYWLSLALLLASFGLGPGVVLGGRILAGSDGQVLWTPLRLLCELVPFMHRFHKPIWLMPMALLACLLALVTSRRRLPAPAGVAAVSLLLLLGLPSPLGLVTWSYAANWGQQARLDPARVPDYCRFLADRPDGAVVDLPLNSSFNAYQLQMHHGHPITSDLAGGAPSILSEQSGLYFQAMTRRALRCLGLPDRAPDPGRQAGTPYGALPPSERSFSMASFGRPEPCGQGRGRRAASAAGLPAVRTELRARGVRFLVLHRVNCAWIAEARGDLLFEALKRGLSRDFGPPVYGDAEVAVFDLR